MSRMICPAAPPSAATAKMSGANWLDRLRSSRGFPPSEADAVDIDHFLAAEASASAPTVVVAEPPSLSNLQAAGGGRGNGKGGQSGEGVAEILCELFAMGRGGRGGGRGEILDLVNCKRKSSRKQQNPKFWDATGSSKKNSNECSSEGFRRQNGDFNGHNNGLASSGDNSLNQHRKERDSKDVGELGVGVEEEEEVDLKGYSKSEVTVIDSSIQGWRSKMFVFRKRKSKSVWKVREKKSKSRSLMGDRRKRKSMKGNLGDKDDDEDNDGDEKRRKQKKKKIVRASDSIPGSLSMNGKEHAVVPLINEGQCRDDKMEQTLNGVHSLHCEAPIKSFPCSSSYWKLKSEASSVILVRPISTFDTSGTGKPRKISINKGQILL